MNPSSGPYRAGRKGVSRKVESCEECRRLKLKCNRIWPCENCLRRKTAHLCPDDKLETGKHHRRSSLTEDRPDVPKSPLQRRHSSQTSPRLDSLHAPNQQRSQTSSARDSVTRGRPSLPNVFSPVQSTIRDLSHDSSRTGSTQAGSPDYATAAASSSRSGFIALHADGTGEYVGQAGAPLYTLSEAQSPPPAMRPAFPSASMARPRGSLGFPFAETDPAQLQADMFLLRDVASVTRALERYEMHVHWMYRIIELPDVRDDLQTLTSVGHAKLPAHRIAVVFMVLALGELFAPLNETQMANERSPALYCAALDCLTLSGQHFLYRHSPASCEALHLVVTFLFNRGDMESSRAAWPLLGLSLRIAQATGLHKNSRDWQLPLDQVARRERILAESITYDRLQSLNFGRPHMISDEQVEADPPQLPEEPSGIEGQSIVAFHHIKYAMSSFFAQVSDAFSGGNVPDSKTILQMDRQARSFLSNSPSYLRFGAPSLAGEHCHLAPQRLMLELLVHKALLFIHRPFFAEALLHSNEPLSSPRAASFVACIKSARQHTLIMQTALQTCPASAFHWWFFAFHAATAAVIQSLVVIKATCSLMQPECWIDFKLSYDIFANMPTESRIVQRTLPILHELKTRACQLLGEPAPRISESSY
ncbi:uncharacterized protein L969DRAFT_97832, partial [Mixia osmundae IAM 14324]